MVFRAVKFSLSTAKSHTNELLPLPAAQIMDGKGIAFLKIYDRLDWNLLSIVKSLNFCRL